MARPATGTGGRETEPLPEGDGGAASPSAAPLHVCPPHVRGDNRPVPAPARTLGLGSFVLACLAATLALGLAIKAPCASGDWGDGRQYTRLCYSDIEPLLGTEQLAGGRLPYLDACVTASAGECDEYPVLSMWTMRVAAWLSGPEITRFFYANVLLLTIAAFATAVCLYLMTGGKALYFALAPTLLVYGYINWDLIAVAFATAGTLMYLRRRDVWSGALLGIGAAAKLYPALLVVAFVAGRFRAREPDRGIHLAWSAVGAWLALNLPFALAAPGSWWEFFRFNSARPADWDSLWFIGCHRITGEFSCGHVRLINVASAIVFAAAVAIVWRLKAARDPGFPRWTLGLPILIVFLLTNKVYSPQYGLWLLPWFALALPNLRLFVAFSLADVAVFVTRFSWFGTLSDLEGGLSGIPIGAFELAVIVRAVVLVLCVAAWVRRRTPPPEPVPPPEPERALADAIA